ncbi:MAG: tRNA (adenosine(37)-N6)-dimethylallyltransferase MiaA, partial [Candidatus Liptonbacteria bacterium]|nr:tRNA (adenosine(37)-N6)-dimethylallyltransferase MiaA [Candidatus Liptonbacteria bacterium]
MRPKALVILGPTATGKSDFAVTLAKKFDGEIISADSRQVYRGLDLGTGKVPRDAKPHTPNPIPYLYRGIPHYLLDVANPNRIFTASNYARLAKRAIKKILAKGKLPILCGGTGFYIASALEKQSFAKVPPNKKLRKKLESKTVAELFLILKKLDPERAETIDAKNPRRLVRAIEIIEALGHTPARDREEEYETLKIGLVFPKEKLKARINTRLLKRLKLGLIKEIKNLHANGLSWKRMDDLGLEYRYLSRYLRGILTKEEMISELEAEIYRYAKRQLTWFGRDKNIHWINPHTQRRICFML